MPKKNAPFTRAESFEKNKVVYFRKDGSVEIRKGGTRAWRNNNPGNIISDKGNFVKRHGAIGKAAGFGVFPDAETGGKAQKALLKLKVYQKLSMGAVIRKYAPKKDGNSPEQYIKFLEKSTGTKRSENMSDLSDKQLDKLLEGIRKYEGTKPGETYKLPPGMGSYVEHLASGGASLPSMKESPEKRKKMLGLTSHSTISGETLRRDGVNYRLVWRIEEDGSTRGYFVSP